MEITVNDINFLVELANRLNGVIPLSTPERTLLQDIVKRVNEGLEAQSKQQEVPVE